MCDECLFLIAQKNSVLGIYGLIQTYGRKVKCYITGIAASGMEEKIKIQSQLDY